MPLALLLAVLAAAANPAAANPAAAQSAAAQSARIAAASDLQFVLPEIKKSFEAETGLAIDLIFGASGNLARQIQQGAPFEVFFSADEDYAQKVVTSGHATSAGEIYAIGRIALFVPTGSTLRADADLAGLIEAVGNNRLTRLAIANPAHAPYGQRAQQVLTHLGLWQKLQDRLVLGENVAQAAQFALTGNADGALIAKSLAASPVMSRHGTFTVVPENWHAPLRQRYVVLSKASQAALAFAAYIRTPPARALFEKFGFALPDNGT